MEARAPFRAASVSKTFVAAILVIAALCLGAIGGYVAKGISGVASSQTLSRAQAAPGTVLRQDAPAQAHFDVAPGTVLRQDAPARTSGGTHRGYRGGPQSIDDVAGTWSSNPGYDAGDVREGHGA